MRHPLLDEGDRLLRTLDNKQRQRAERENSFVVISLNLGDSKAGHDRVQTRRIHRSRARELGFDV